MRYLVIVNTENRNYTILVDSIEDAKSILDTTTRVFNNVTSVNTYELQEIMKHVKTTSL